MNKRYDSVYYMTLTNDMKVNNALIIIFLFV
jgi:hypothetical protein